MTLAREMALESEYVMGTFARKPVEFVEGHGMTLIDDAGKEYLDFLSGIGVCSLGHCHPSIVQAVSDQAAKLIHVSNYYYIEHRGEVAQLLSNMLNAYVDEPSPETWKTFFANSGAEANECAIKLARLYARRRTEAAGKDAELAPRLIVTLAKSHGRTFDAGRHGPAGQAGGFQPLATATPINDVKRSSACSRLRATHLRRHDRVHPGRERRTSCTEEFIGAIRRLTEEHGALMMRCKPSSCPSTTRGVARHRHHEGIASGVVAALPSGGVRITAPPGGSNIAMAAAHVIECCHGREIESSACAWPDRPTGIGDLTRGAVGPDRRPGRPRPQYSCASCRSSAKPTWTCRNWQLLRFRAEQTSRLCPICVKSGAAPSAFALYPFGVSRNQACKGGKSSSTGHYLKWPI